jgi:hypothetical protein
MKLPTAGRTGEMFLDLGVQYYVAGRYAAFAGLAPVSGNLLHHAIEMFLKGGLANALSSSDLRNLGHSLAQSWERFKVEFNDVDLTRFDEIVTQLDKFERIRYPDRVLTEGMQVRIEVTGPVVASFLTPPSSVPIYDLVLCQVDELVKAIVATINVDPTFFLGSLVKPEAREFLAKENQFPLG